MKQLFRMGLALVIILLNASTIWASAESTHHIVISEIQTGSSVSASEEFIELYNPTDTDVVMSDWTVDYKSATSPDTPASWTTRASLNGHFASHGYILLAPAGYLPFADADWRPTLAASGGVVRIAAAGGTIIDRVGYGVGTIGAEGGVPAPAPSPGASIERTPADVDGSKVDTDVNAADFRMRASPQPQASGSVSDPVEPIEDPGDTTEDPEELPDASLQPAELQITELLPDPVAPLTDANDEFIELYNPTAASVSLAGYTLRTGSSFHDSYVLPDIELSPQAYIALYSRDTKLALTNSGGVVQLVGPGGTVIDLTQPYSQAPPGQSWSRFENEWRWTLQTTPGIANQLVALPLVATKKTSTVKAKAAKTSVKKATVKKTRAKKAKVATARRLSPATSLVAGTRTFQLPSRLLIALAVLTIGYATYEFRYDIYNTYLKLRRNQGSG